MKLISKTLALTMGLFVTFSSTFAAKSFEPVQWQTSNGARVLFYQAMEVPMLELRVAFAAGSAYDGEQHGLSTLTTQLLNQGNGGFDANTIAEKLAQSGAQYESETTRDMSLLKLKTLTLPTALKETIDALALIINHPDFTSEAFKREQNKQIMAILQEQESPGLVATQTFFKALYQQHPYGHAVSGDIEHVKALRPEQVRNFYKQFYNGSNALIVLVGAIDEATARSIADRLTKDLPQGKPSSAIPKISSLTEEMNVEVPFPSSQAMLRLGQLGIDHHDKRFFPLMVGNYILGGNGLVSRLAIEIREKRGLTYGVYSQFEPMPGPGPFIISLSTRVKEAKNALELIRMVLSTFVKTGPNEKELMAAKQYLTGSFPIALASNQGIADILVKIAFYHLPNDYLDTYVDKINAVNLTQIKQAFQLITPDKLLQVTTGGL